MPPTLTEPIKSVGTCFRIDLRVELIADDNYLLEVSRYIHNNPVKACMTQNAGDYEWSSYNNYTGAANNNYFLDTSKVLGLFSNRKTTAVKEYVKFVGRKNEEQLRIMDVDEDSLPDGKKNREYITTPEEALLIIDNALRSKNCTFEKLNRDIELRNSLIKKIRGNSSLTLKQLGQLFDGISESRVSRY